MFLTQVIFDQFDKEVKYRPPNIAQIKARRCALTATTQRTRHNDAQTPRRFFGEQSHIPGLT
jgi:hypothetical protein